MVSLRSRCMMVLSVLAGIAGFTSLAYAQEPLPLQLKFPLYSQAYEAHSGLQRDSAKVSAIEFADVQKIRLCLQTNRFTMENVNDAEQM